mgnify:FL=1
MIVNGRALAKKIEHDLIVRTRALEYPPRLTVIVVGENPVSERFIRMKSEFAARIGVNAVIVRLPESVGTEGVVAEIKKQSPLSDGIIVQLPLPLLCDTEAILSAIPKGKDVDSLLPAGRQVLPPLVLSPVVGAVKRILSEGRISLKGKRVLIIGRGRLVGMPLSEWLSGNGTTVDIIGDEVEDITLYTRIADIIISGTGEPHLIKPHMIKEGVVLIDCGTSEAGGRTLGDADPACADKCSLFTPVPGGVGPVTVAILFENLFSLIDH